MRRKGLRRRRSDDPRAGQALVEFALVAPILLLLLLGIVDFARAWNVYEVLTDAAREGAREAVVDNGRTEAEVRQIIVSAAAMLVPISLITHSAQFLDRIATRSPGSRPSPRRPFARRSASLSAAARAGIEVTDADIQITGMGSGRGNPTTVRIEHVYPLRFVGALVSLAQGSNELVLATEFAMRNE